MGVKMYPERPGVTSLVSIPAYCARRVFPKEVFIPSLANTNLILTVKNKLPQNTSKMQEQHTRRQG